MICNVAIYFFLQLALAEGTVRLRKLGNAEWGLSSALRLASHKAQILKTLLPSARAQLPG